MDDNNTKKNLIWLTIPHCCYINEITFSQGEALEKNSHGQIWFEDIDDNRSEAEALVKEIKKLIYQRYSTHPQYKEWLTETWLNKPINWKHIVDGSVLTTEEYRTQFPKDEKYQQRFNAEASVFYRKKMMELVDNDPSRIGEMRGYVPGRVLGGHLMYRIDPLYSEDGHRMYESLIEYDTETPSEGIYYGCRGITLKGFDHDVEIEVFRQDWENIKGELCAVLNNTFPSKDFSHRFKMTDNANTNTYWLFWITLQEDEDIKKVGVVAIHKIREVFQRYLQGKAIFAREMREKKLEDDTAFMTANYNALLSSYKNPDRFVAFLNAAENEGWIKPHPLYEKAWQFVGEGQHNKNVDFIAMMKEAARIFNDGKVPWALLACVFLDSDGYAFENLRTQQSTMKNDTFIIWEEKLKKIRHLIS